MTTILLFNQVNKALAYKLTSSKLLAALALHDTAMNATQLAKAIHISTAAITRIIDDMGDVGIVERRRHKMDRRQITLHLTKHGRSVVKDILNPEPLEDDA